MDEYQAHIDHTTRQLALLAECPPAQFVPGIPELPEARQTRRLIELGVIPANRHLT